MVNSVWLSHFLFRSLGSFFIFSQKDLKTVKFLFQCLTRCPSLQFPSSRTFHRIRDWLLWSDKKMHKVLLLLLLLSEYFHLEMKTRLVYAAMRPSHFSQRQFSISVCISNHRYAIHNYEQNNNFYMQYMCLRKYSTCENQIFTNNLHKGGWRASVFVLYTSSLRASNKPLLPLARKHRCEAWIRVDSTSSRWLLINELKRLSQNCQL